LEVRESGAGLELYSDEAVERLQQYGPSTSPKEKSISHSAATEAECSICSCLASLGVLIGHQPLPVQFNVEKQCETDAALK
jgi:hypothetical protein